MNITVGAFLSKFLDFSQFAVDSSENDTENNYERLMFFFSRSAFYIWRILPSYYRVNSSKSDDLVKVTKPGNRSLGRDSVMLPTRVCSAEQGMAWV